MNDTDDPAEGAGPLGRQSALARLKASRSQTRAQSREAARGAATGAQPPRHAAATSHRENARYMSEMEHGMRALGIDASPTMPQSPASRHDPGGRHAGVAGGARAVAAPLVGRGMGGVGWRNGPEAPAGVLVDLSDRPLVCSSCHGGMMVIGGTDHALYEIDLATGKKRRQLYTRTFGHKEWVTCVAHTPDGRVISGGMDSKLCLWDARGTRCVDLEGHAGSVSACAVGDDGRLAVSASYDKTLRLWDLGSRAGRNRGRGALTGHKAPVLTLAWGSEKGGLASGDRDGMLLLWDSGLGADAPALGKRRAHDGHCTSLRWVDATGGGAAGTGGDNLLLSGGQDGFVRAWDPRVAGTAPIAEASAHTAADGGAGAVGDIVQAPGTGGRVVTAGADGTVAVLDPRAGLAQVGASVPCGDFVYSLASFGAGLAFAGTGAGNLLAIDAAADEPKALYGLGANGAAVRCVAATKDRLAAAGDDGKVIVYTFMPAD